MYTSGYFRRNLPATTTTTDGGGTGLTTEQTQLLTDLKTWRDTQPGVADRPLLEHLRDLLSRFDIQSAALKNTSGNPDLNLVKQGELFLAFSSKAEASQLAATNVTLNLMRPKFEFVTQSDPGPIYLPTLRLVPYTTYGVYGLTGFEISGFSTTDFCVLYIGHPFNTEPFEVTIMNLSPSGKRLRIYCDTPQSIYDKREYVTFRRGANQSAVWSTTNLEPNRALRLVFYPKSYNVFFRTINPTTGQRIPVPGFIEYDEEGDPSRSLTDLNND